MTPSFMSLSVVFNTINLGILLAGNHLEHMWSGSRLEMLELLVYIFII